MKCIIKSPETEKEFENYYFLRWKILREPYKKNRGTEKDDLEDESIHVLIKDKSSKVIAVGRLHFLKNKFDAQIRYMAVDKNYQGLGYGSILIKELEKIALKNNIRSICLNSRKNVIRFYEKNDYSIMKKSYLLFNEVQHWLMKKELKK